MSWGLGWKRPSEIFHLTLSYGEAVEEEIPTVDPSPPHPSNDLGFRIDLDWSTGDDEDQIALRLQSQLMVALPPLQDSVVLRITEKGEGSVGVDMDVVKMREPLRSITMSKPIGSGQQSDGTGVLTRLVRSELAPSGVADRVLGFSEHWKSVTVLNLCACNLLVRVSSVLNFLVLECCLVLFLLTMCNGRKLFCVLNFSF